MRTKRKIINLHDDKNIFSIKHVMSISTEEDLNQLWDFLTNSKDSSHYLINQFTTQLYNFALSYMAKKDAEYFEITLEESDENFYFTLQNKNISLLFKSYLEPTSIKYIYDKNKISVKLKKKKYQANLEKINNDNIKRENNLIKSITKGKSLKTKEPYTFIENDDLDELLKLSDDLQNVFYVASKNGFDENSFISLRSLFSLFCLTLRYYDRISPMANTITNFSNLINTNKDKFTNLSKDELCMISGFVNNIDYWLNTLFIKGGSDLYFMDNSIEADYQMISQIINPKYIYENESTLDDIFEF